MTARTPTGMRVNRSATIVGAVLGVLAAWFAVRACLIVLMVSRVASAASPSPRRAVAEGAGLALVAAMAQLVPVCALLVPRVRSVLLVGRARPVLVAIAACAVLLLIDATVVPWLGNSAINLAIP